MLFRTSCILCCPSYWMFSTAILYAWSNGMDHNHGFYYFLATPYFLSVSKEVQLIR